MHIKLLNALDTCLYYEVHAPYNTVVSPFAWDARATKLPRTMSVDSSLILPVQQTVHSVRCALKHGRRASANTYLFNCT